jgi:hypothetical protein
MPIVDLKKTLINEIEALKILNNGFPTLSLGNSMPSINNTENAFDFLVDLIKSITGFEQIKAETINFLTYQINPLEASLKILLKNLLKKYFSCSIDSIIPQELITDGINIAISQIDFFDMFKTDPTSSVGKMIYGSNAQDLNTFIYDVIQLQGTSDNWKNIFDLQFVQTAIVAGEQKNNVLNLKIDASYTGEKVNTWVNDFIDSIAILSLPLLINRIFDNLFGIISLRIGKSFQKLKEESEIDTLIEKIIDLPDRIIDDSYYEFTRDEIEAIDELTKNRVRGIKILTSCNFVESTVDFQTVANLDTDLNNAATLVDIKTVLDNTFTILENQATENANTVDRPLGVLEFYSAFFRGIIKGIVNILLSPKIIFLFVTYFRIVNLTVGFRDLNDFITEHREFFIEIVRNIVLPIIIDFLTKLVLKLVKKLIIDDNINKQRENIKNYQLQLYSLLGIPDRITSLFT